MLADVCRMTLRMFSVPSKLHPRQVSSPADLIAYAVLLTDLVRDDLEAVAFYQSVFANHPEQFVTYNDLRKIGELLSRDELKALGMRANTKLSKQFLATLNDVGISHPMHSAQVIGSAISTALCTQRDLKQITKGGFRSAKFHASKMAAGPCELAADFDGSIFIVSDAPILPLKGCTELGQCGCMYGLSSPLLDDL